MIPMRPRRTLSRSPIAVLALLAAVLAGFVLARPLLPVDETRYLSVAWEMWQSGDLLHLTRNGALYAHKPPLLFWIINLVWSVTGVSELPARLVGPAFGVATAWASARLARQLWPDAEGIGVRAILVLCGFSVFLIYASATMFDTMLALATVAGVVGGALIGRAIEQNVAGSHTVDVYRVTVRFDDGGARSFDYHQAPNVRVGDRVRAEGNQLYR